MTERKLEHGEARYLVWKNFDKIRQLKADFMPLAMIRKKLGLENIPRKTFYDAIRVCRKRYEERIKEETIAVPVLDRRAVASAPPTSSEPSDLDQKMAKWQQASPAQSGDPLFRATHGGEKW